MFKKISTISESDIIKPLPKDEIALQEPPTLPEESDSGLSTFLMYIPMGMTSAAMMMMFIQPGTQVIGYMTAMLMGLSGVGMFVAQMLRTSTSKKNKSNNDRRDYLRYLSHVRQNVIEKTIEQYKIYFFVYPNPKSLINILGTKRFWYKDLNNMSFGDIRVGTANRRQSLNFTVPETKPIEDLDPMCSGALKRFINAYSYIFDVPISIQLRGFSKISIYSENIKDKLEFVYSIIASFITIHSPNNVKISLLTSSERLHLWDFMKWIPFVYDTVDNEKIALLFDDEINCINVLNEYVESRFEFGFAKNDSSDLEYPYLILLIDQNAQVSHEFFKNLFYDNVLTIDISGSLYWNISSSKILCVKLEDGHLIHCYTDEYMNDINHTICKYDKLSYNEITILSRALSGYKIDNSIRASELELSAGVPSIQKYTNDDFLSSYNVNHIDELNVINIWNANTNIRNMYKTNIGIGIDDHNIISLDIKESAQGGIGPHGLLIGATGSGKSELLRTLVIGMAVNNSPKLLNFVLIDFKGGATFQGLENLPHVSAMITNLQDSSYLVERMQDSLKGEIARRQEILRDAQCVSVQEYNKKYVNKDNITYSHLPVIFIVIDEFSELLSQYRESIDLFIAIGRVGRSLGIHMLMASQKLDEGKVYQLESHISYRICLRTFSAIESRSVIGVPDAYNLKSDPGVGFLKVDNQLIKFKSFYVSERIRKNIQLDAISRKTMVDQIVKEFNIDSLVNETRNTLMKMQNANAHVLENEITAKEEEEELPTLLECTVNKIHEARGPNAKQIWLPPLDVSLTLNDVLPPIDVNGDYGFCSYDWAYRGEFKVPVALIDKPFEGIRDIYIIDFNKGSGHVGIAGAIRTGKSMLLRTLIMSLVLTHTPLELQIYCIDLSGNSFNMLNDLLHIGAVATKSEIDKIMRIFYHINSIINVRESIFQKYSLDNLLQYRELLSTNQLSKEFINEYSQYSNVIILIFDGWTVVKSEMHFIEELMLSVMNRGSKYGVHVVISTLRWSDIKSTVRDLLSTRIEFKLGDHLDSDINPRLAKTISNLPGRGITMDSHHFISVLPRYDNQVGVIDDIPDVLRNMVASINGNWKNDVIPHLQVLPNVITDKQMPKPYKDIIPIGYDQISLHAMFYDVLKTPNMLCIGESGSGKSNLLKYIIKCIEKNYDIKEAKVILADYKREFVNLVSKERLLGYATSRANLDKLLFDSYDALKNRIPKDDEGMQKLTVYDYKVKGPRLFIIIDDYDVVFSSNSYDNGNGGMNKILSLLNYSSDIGLNIILSRGTVGLSRATSDRFFNVINDTVNIKCVFSCSKDDAMYLDRSIKAEKLLPGRCKMVMRTGQYNIIQTPILVNQ